MAWLNFDEECEVNATFNEKALEELDIVSGHIEPLVTLASLEAAERERDELKKTWEAAAKNPWCPDVCPLTQRPFFMWIDGEPTYGGPFDSYTIPTRDADGEYSCRRYDHDEGGWKDWSEGLSIKVVDESDWLGLEERADTAEARLAAAREALKPFSDWVNRQEEAERVYRNSGFSGWSDDLVPKTDVTLGDFRRARAALAGSNGE